MRMAPVCAFSWRSTKTICPGCGVLVAVGEGEREGQLAGGAEQIASLAAAGAAGEGEVFGIRDGEVDLDGIEGGDAGEDRLRADEVADLRGGLTGDAGDERADLGEAEVEPGGIDLCLGGGDGGLGGGDGGLPLRFGLLVVVKLRLGDGALFGERGVTLDVDLREAELRLCLAELALGLPDLTLGLLEDGLEGAGIDLEEDLALLDGGAFLVELANEVAGDLRLDLGVGVAVEGTDPVAGERDIFLLDGDDTDGHGSHGGGVRATGRIAGLGAAGSGHKREEREGGERATGGDLAGRGGAFGHERVHEVRGGRHGGLKPHGSGHETPGGVCFG